MLLNYSTINNAGAPTYEKTIVEHNKVSDVVDHHRLLFHNTSTIKNTMESITANPISVKADSICSKPKADTSCSGHKGSQSQYWMALLISPADHTFNNLKEYVDILWLDNINTENISPDTTWRN